MGGITLNNAPQTACVSHLSLAFVLPAVGTAFLGIHFSSLWRLLSLLLFELGSPHTPELPSGSFFLSMLSVSHFLLAPHEVLKSVLRSRMTEI